ncbi:zinc finger BED domain-containing protein RICESLEEPER 1-like [Olea europaea var. sylvestris]|uniref:zinc finger BED domain-containing protein RICESLEEPER 1-like n=1 Tax=Olea europaea var. sylvestris TaxID=158386 RepID=UPI000C1CD957|nr:zinc finger BED domain-containing protein RICESLEEPER 1-like [Olea europaea var. sylvestris]
MYRKKVLKNWKVDGMVLGGWLMHIRCCAHIMNLIVNDGLKEFHMAIATIGNVVKYFRSSPSRLAKFKICVEREKIECIKLAMLDVPTRWNATYLMLDSVFKFEKAFDRMADVDGFYCKYFDKRENGKEREGPPTSDDWEKGRKFVKFLKTFYEITLKFSASLSVTSNLYFKEVCNIQQVLKSLSDRQDPLLSDMAINMKSKFDKYWGSVEKMNKILIIAIVLDPRYMLEFVGYCIGRLYDNNLVETTKDEIKSLLYELYNQYKGWNSASNDECGGNCDFNILMEVSTDDDWDESNNFDFGYKNLKSNNNDLLGKDEIQRYLMESIEDSTNHRFDILTWWKLNCPRYAILSEIARDVLAIPVSTVASKSAFSTEGHVFYSFRSSLTPKTVEALICTQNWLRSTLLGDRLYGVSIEETEFHEELVQLETKLVGNCTHKKNYSNSTVVELD